MAERLQKILSQWGIASRRRAESLIAAGRVRVNGEVAVLGQRADPTGDRIEVDGQCLTQADRPTLQYLLLNKPAGVVSTCHDPQRRPTVLDLVPSHQLPGLHPVGRLDAESTGALLLTNDGELTFALTHPSHEISKTYQVWVAGRPTAATLKHWRMGVMLEGRKTFPATVTVVAQTAQQTQLEIVLWEGRNRQIRRVAEQLGHPVLSLHRTAIGSLQLGQLPSGQMRSLTPAEITDLQQQVYFAAR